MRLYDLAMAGRWQEAYDLQRPLWPMDTDIDWSADDEQVPV